MNLCLRCGRKLRNPSPNGMGPKCALAVLGSKPKRPRTRTASPSSDLRQIELVLEVPA